MMSRHTRQLTDPHTDALWGVRARVGAHTGTRRLHRRSDTSQSRTALRAPSTAVFADISIFR